MARLILIPFIVILTGCMMHKEDADLIITNATIYTVDENFNQEEMRIIYREYPIKISETLIL